MKKHEGSKSRDTILLTSVTEMCSIDNGGVGAAKPEKALMLYIQYVYTASEFRFIHFRGLCNDLAMFPAPHFCMPVSKYVKTCKFVPKRCSPAFSPSIRTHIYIHTANTYCI
jgi:hypothetical protein